MSYLEQHQTRETAQAEPMRADQVENSAGGFVWAVDGWTRLRRFLVLGSEGGSYYASERQLTKENVGVLLDLVRSDGERLVAEVVAVSEAGRAPSNDPALYALAAAISHGDAATKRAAAEALPAVARIGTHLYHFARFLELHRGWGRAARWAVANWYLGQDAERLAYQLVKYRQRDGWSHRDLLRLSHPRARDVERAMLFQWATHGADEPSAIPPFDLVEGFEAAQRAETPARTAQLVRDYWLPREALNPEHLTDPAVWGAMLEAGMPLGALTRNLANMTRIGVLDDRGWRDVVLDQLADADAIRRSRLHPLAILVALSTYATGRGLRGRGEWTPLPAVVDALDAAFYLAFGNVEATGKSTLLALDVSGSMSTGSVAGSPLTPREASAALALVALHVERDVEVVGFTSGRGGGYLGGPAALTPLGLSSRQRLDDAVRAVSNLPFGGTDCALPMLYATEAGKDFESFVILTDSETWAGSVHPKQALDRYRDASGIGARCAVVGMVSNGFSIADPSDAGMLDVVGFDTATPQVLSDFAAGRV
jgi:60 kDa SS-A/Ro ribonucleoprotein